MDVGADVQAEKSKRRMEGSCSAMHLKYFAGVTPPLPLKAILRRDNSYFIDTTSLVVSSRRVKDRSQLMSLNTKITFADLPSDSLHQEDFLRS